MNASNNLVWIIDDEMDLANAYSDYLKPSYETKVFFSAKEALQHFDSGNDTPSIIVSDVRIPEMDGLKFLCEVRSRNDSIPTILISGNSNKNDLVQATTLGIQGYLDKPFHPDQLEKLIDKNIKKNITKSTSSEMDALNQEYRTVSKSLLNLYVERYTFAENVLFDLCIKHPNGAEDRKKYLEDCIQQNQLNRVLEALDHKISELQIKKTR